MLHAPGLVQAGPLPCGTMDCGGIATVEVPHWEEHGLLRWCGLYKHFRIDALAPRAILGRFQRDGWCKCIDNPLPEDPETPRDLLLGRTVSNLNRVLKGWGIRFHAEGKGGRVRWQALV